jgi:IS30 family transposase
MRRGRRVAQIPSVQTSRASELYKSLTWDRGKELADHRQFTLATNIDVYFCDPQSRGSAAQMRTPMVC